MITELETRILSMMDEIVEHGTDDELFASGYLRGHLTLAVAELEAQPATPWQMYQQVLQHLEQAIECGELSPPDQALVRDMWHLLYQQALP